MIIDFHKYNGGGGSISGLTDYWNSAVTEQHIESAASITYASATSYTDAALQDIDLSAYYTSAQTEEAITSKGYASSAYVDTQVASAYTILDAHIEDVEEVSASALTELHEGLLELSARTVFNPALYTPTSGFSTINGSAITAGGNLVIEGGSGPGPDMSAYWTSAETEDYISNQGFATMNDIPTSNTALTNDAGYITSSDVYTEVSTYPVSTFSNDAGYLTSADLSSELAGYNVSTFSNDAGYITTADTQDFITSAYVADALTAYTPSTGFSSINGSAITAGGNLVIEGGSVPDLSGYMTSGDAQVISTALVDLNTRLSGLSAASQSYVTSGQVETQITGKHYTTSSDQSVINIVKIEQSAYNTLVAQSATTSTTLYIVVPDSN